MLLNESFCQFFDKTSSNNFGFTKRFDVWSVQETDPSATLTSLQVLKNNAEFIGFNQNLTKAICCLTHKRSSKFKDRECDGIAFVNINGKEERLLFVELKSKFDTEPVFDAISQMCFSFLKMHSMLSLCEGYSLREIPIDFCAATKCAKDDDETAKVKIFISHASMSTTQAEKGTLLKSLFLDGKVSVKFHKLFQIMKIDLPVCNDIKDKEITIYLQKTQTYNNTQSLFCY